MTQKSPRIIELHEYLPKWLSRSELTYDVAEHLWRDYRRQVAVDFPSPVTDWRWRLTAQGWIGFIPLSAEIGLSLLPKVPLQNVFRMLDYAYSLKSISFLDSMYRCESLREVYEYLANVLARQILNRGRKGLYKDYIQATENLPFVRGRLDLHCLMRSPWKVSQNCQYEEHTADIDENKLIAWTLFVIARSGVCTDRVLPNIRKAYHCLQALVSLEPFKPLQCVNRQYNRLNEDYRPMHLLCKFFLENMGPTYNVGDYAMIPFVINVANLYELFVAEWLRAHLPTNLRITKQEHVPIGTSDDLYFKIDIVLSDAETNTARYVLDTKYKGDERPKAQDIAQVVAYANAVHCKEAVLIYPKQLSNPISEMVGDINVRSVGFNLEGGLEEAGESFLGSLFRGS